MNNPFKGILTQTAARISDQFMLYAPGILVGIVIALSGYVLARMLRWLLVRIFKGNAFDRFLRQSGLASMLNSSGRLRGVDLVANSVFWLIFLSGILIGIGALDTRFTTRLTESVVTLFPKLLAAAGIVLAGIWLGRFLGRHVLVWAVNEGFPSSRMLSAIVRILVVMVAATAAADHLNFAPRVFLATLIIVGGGVMLTASISLGLCGKDAVHRYLRQKQENEANDKEETSNWRHL